MKIVTEMKTLLILSVLGLLVGCSDQPGSDIKVTNGVWIARGDIDEVDYRGHRYLAYGPGALIHAEHCPCKASYATNVALNNAFLGSLMPPPAATNTTNAIAK